MKDDERDFTLCYSEGVPLWRDQGGAEGERSNGLCADCGGRAGERGGGVYGQSRERGAAGDRQGTFEGDGRQGARGGNQRGQCELRRGAGRPGCGAGHVRGRGGGVWLQGAGGVSVVDGDYWRAATGGEIDCSDARAGVAAGIGVGSLSAGGGGDSHDRYGGENGVRAI